MDYVERFRPNVHIQSDLIRCALSEFFSTALLMFGGCCVSAQFVLSRGTVNTWFGVNIGWGLVLTFAVYAGFYISGSHLNPAVSFFLFTMGRLSGPRCVVYSIAQTVGAFVGAAFTFLTYYDAFMNFDGGERQVSGPLATAGVFATYPKPYLTVIGGLVDQIIGTAFLCICVSLITDKKNKIPGHLQPLLIGLLVALIGMTVGMNSGYAINPARDLGPRLFTLCAGWGIETFSYRNYTWFWIPLLGPMIGAVVGAWIYQLCIGMQLDIESVLNNKKSDETTKQTTDKNNASKTTDENADEELDLLVKRRQIITGSIIWKTCAEYPRGVTALGVNCFS
uniref:Aquaporin-3 n=1 Tax=Ascaris suum TaxID=6253 RepID=F1L4B4_ASCSU